MLAPLASLPVVLAVLFGASAPQAPAVKNKAAPPSAQPLENKMIESQAKSTTPDLAMIEFLGEYADAADGLDPLGLSEQRVVVAPAPTHKPESHR
jgi:hypothetical protein